MFSRNAALIAGLALTAALSCPAAAQAQTAYDFDLPAQKMADSLRAVGRQAGVNVAFSPKSVAGLKVASLHGVFSPEAALARLLTGSGLVLRRVGASTFVVEAPKIERVGTAPAPDAATAIEELVVTARKREERLLDIPAPISALGAATLERHEAVRLEDYLALVPGATVENVRAGQTKISFRGVNNGATNATVVIYVDDTPLTGSTGHASSAFVTPNLDPSDLARIEVLRGPQGTLYGANAIGGVLRYVTVEPDTNKFGGRLEVGGEAVAHGAEGLSTRGAVNIPLVSDKAALRVSGYDREDPGFIDDPFLGLKDENDVRVWGGHAALLIKPTDDLKITLSALTQSMKSHGNDTVDYDPFTQQPYYGDLEHHRYLRNEWFNSKYSVFNGTAQWTLPFATALSSTSYSMQDNGANTDGTPAYGPLLSGLFGVPNLGFDNPLVVHLHKFTQEFRLTSSGPRKLDWQVGAFYTHEGSTYDQSANLFDTTTQNYINSFGDIFVATLDGKYDEYSAFGNVDYHLTDAFDVAVGARYSVDDQKFHLLANGLLIGPAQDISQPSHETAFTWLVNPRYKFSEDQMVYARAASGYRPGGANPLTAPAIAAGVSPTYKADHLISYEAGWKGAFLDRRLTADIAAYYVAWTDIQLLVNLAGFNFEGNGGKAHSEGIESSFTWRPVDGLNLGANLTYNTNRLDRDDQSNPDLSQAGNRLPGTPKFSASLSADYEREIMPTTSAFVGATVVFATDRPSGLALGYDPAKASGTGAVSNFGTVTIYDSTTGAVIGRASTRLPGYATLDLRAGVEHDDWTLSAYIKNLTDARVLSTYGGLNDPTFSNFATIWSATVLRPRTVGLSLACKF